MNWFEQRDDPRGVDRNVARFLRQKADEERGEDDPFAFLKPWRKRLKHKTPQQTPVSTLDRLRQRFAQEPWNEYLRAAIEQLEQGGEQ